MKSPGGIIFLGEVVDLDICIMEQILLIGTISESSMNRIDNSDDDDDDDNDRVEKPFVVAGRVVVMTARNNRQHTVAVLDELAGHAASRRFLLDCFIASRATTMVITIQCRNVAAPHVHVYCNYRSTVQKCSSGVGTEYRHYSIHIIPIHNSRNLHNIIRERWTVSKL
jgi:hypothetical protein